MTATASTPECNAVLATVADARTALFVPGDRPDRFAKACASDADIVIIDLEDAVAAGEKANARRQACQALAPGAEASVRALVRVNPKDSDWFEADVEALQGLVSQPGHGLLGFVLPKAEEPEQVLAARRRVPAGLALVALIESARGVANAVGIAQVPGVTRLAFGAVDFALDIDAGSEPRALDYARSAIVVASRAANITAPLDTPSLAIKDLARVAEDARLGRSFGFSGKLCIHPAQLSAATTAHVPTQEEIDWAQQVITVSDTGAAQANGEMIDRPVIKRALRILTRAGKNHS
ncbi:CoA ester lyase [Citricoccus sp. NPDC055426]|uniref:HpcH/HpaI aldolase/citrate lyase family protein n=1 Tax=Citricoccus sp. NPDC055426 TaxID=3155536 RepID=UPI00342F125C